MKKLIFLLIFISIFSSLVYGESTFVHRDKYHYGFISPHPDSGGRLSFGSDSIPWKYIGGIYHNFYPQGAYPLSPDTGTIFYYKNYGWKGYGEDGWVSIPTVDTIYPPELQNYDFVFTVTPTPLMKHDFTTIKEAVDSANVYATDSTRCLVRIMPGQYHTYQSIACSNYVDIIGLGTPTIYVDSLPGNTYFLNIGTCIIGNLTFIADKKINEGAIIKTGITNAKTIRVENVRFKFDSLGYWLYPVNGDTFRIRNIKIEGTGYMKRVVTPVSYLADYLEIDGFEWRGKVEVPQIYPILIPRNSESHISNVLIRGVSYDKKVSIQIYEQEFDTAFIYFDNIDSDLTQICIIVGNSSGATTQSRVVLKNSKLSGGITAMHVLCDSFIIENSYIEATAFPAAVGGVFKIKRLHIYNSKVVNYGEGGILAGGTWEYCDVTDCVLLDYGTAAGILDGTGTIKVYNSYLYQNSDYHINGSDMLRIDYSGHQEYHNCYIRNVRGNLFCESRPLWGTHYFKFNDCTMISDSSRIGWIENCSAAYDQECHIENCNLYAQNIGNGLIVPNYPAGILIKNVIDTTDVLLSIKNSHITSMGPPIWRFNIDTPCSVYVEHSVLESRDSTYAICNSIGEDSLSVVLGPGNRFNPPHVDPTYIQTSDTVGIFGATEFIDNVKIDSTLNMTNHNITGINKASGDTSNFTIYLGDASGCSGVYDSADVTGWNFANYGYDGATSPFIQSQWIDYGITAPDTGLVIQMDSTTGHNNDAIYGLIIKGTGFSSNTQNFIYCVDRTNKWNKVSHGYFTASDGLQVQADNLLISSSMFQIRNNDYYFAPKSPFVRDFYFYDVSTDTNSNFFSVRNSSGKQIFTVGSNSAIICSATVIIKENAIFHDSVICSTVTNAADSSFINSPPIQMTAKGDTAAGNPVVNVETPITMQVKGEFAGDGVIPNYWLEFQDRDDSPFAYLYGKSGSTLSAKLLGSAEIWDTVGTGNKKGQWIYVCGNGDLYGLQSHAKSTGAFATGVYGGAESTDPNTTLLIGGDFYTKPCGKGIHIGVRGQTAPHTSSDSLCCGGWFKANQDGSGDEIGVYGEGDIAFYGDGKIIGIKVTEKTFYAPSEYITGGTVINNKVTLGTATNTYANATPQWKNYGQAFIVDSLQVYYYVIVNDTIDQIQLEEMSNSGSATAKYNYTTDITAAISPTSGSVTLKDSSFTLTGQPYRLNVLTKGAGGNGIYHYRMFMHQAK